MGKRSNFERRERDFYPTPESAVTPLLPHLPNDLLYWEPCAGDGALLRHIPGCLYASDIKPAAPGIEEYNALDQFFDGSAPISHIITNPPWDRKSLHPMIEHFSAMRPSWLLFDADWVHTKQSAPFMPYLRKVVSVGRVKWIPDSKMTGKDNCAWYLFDQSEEGDTIFYGRVAS